MISNGLITSIDRRSGASADGTEVFVPGAAIAPPGLRAFFDDPTGSQHWNLGATIKDATWAVYVQKQDVADAGENPPPPALGDKLNFVMDGDDEAITAGQIILVKDRNFGSLSHWELFLKKV